MKIGIMGGTFDPIHNGHLLLGRQAHEEYHLDSVWYMPSGQPPHKLGRNVTPAEERLEMVRLATSEYSFFAASDFEIKRPGLTYSSDTLSLLHEENPDIRFYFIVGADSFYEIETWHEPALVLSLATLLVARRQYKEERSADEEYADMKAFRDHLCKRYQADIRFLHCRELSLSSSEIREKVALDEDISQDVPAPVADYIERRGLYRDFSDEIKDKR